MMSIRQTPKRKFILIACAIVVILLIGYALMRLLPETSLTQQNDTASVNRQEFPNIDTSQLSTDQQKLLSVLQTEYGLNPDGTKYSEGIKEAWCADFVSWVFNETGMPLSNPNSGSWRIPGTFTLREYYESIGKFEPAGASYSPKVGDIMLYNDPSEFGQHTNIVITNDDGIVTTIGGNEPGGIRIVRHTNIDLAGFIGYGVF